jgi:hypothetical protein
MGSPGEHAEYGTTIVTLTMNPALDVTTSADRSPRQTRSVAAACVTTPGDDHEVTARRWDMGSAYVGERAL